MENCSRRNFGTVSHKDGATFLKVGVYPASEAKIFCISHFLAAGAVQLETSEWET